MSDEVSRQYKTPEFLRARMRIHERYSTNTEPFQPWVFTHIHAPANARVLELGSGPGALWQENKTRVPVSWRVTVSDASAGMLAEARRNLAGIAAVSAFEQVDAQVIPFQDASFDVVIANHMLYHVPDLRAALREINRVLMPGGHVYAVTNGERHMQELMLVIEDVLTGLVPDGVFKPLAPLAFRLENGEALLREVFPSVTLKRVPNNFLRVPDAQVLVAYALSMPHVQRALNAVPDYDVARIKKALQEKMQSLVTPEPFVITKATGLFIASQ